MERRAYSRYCFAFLLLGGLLLLLFIWNVNSGSVSLSVKEIFQIVFFRSGEETAYNIVWEIRLPRILAGIILGG